MTQIVPWDGEPKIVMSWPQLSELYSHAPQWQGSATGPSIPFSGGLHAKVDVTTIFQTTREAARAALDGHIRRACEQEGLEYDENAWTVTSLVLVGGC